MKYSINKSYVLTIVLFLMSFNVNAFCGFFAAKADSKLFNKSSRVVIARDGNTTVLTMANDYQGDVSEFAMVIPVPVVPSRDDITIGDNEVIDLIDAYTAPRLVEYHDSDPCASKFRGAHWSEAALGAVGGYRGSYRAREVAANNYGVKIKAKYSVGEYDILILSGKESSGLIRWLKENDYKIPENSEDVIGSYLKQNMYFFVAKVNLNRQRYSSNSNYSNLRPLKIRYEHSRFMLPIRLGMLNANGAQELYVYFLTINGRVETTNYRTVNLPTNRDVPLYVKDYFGDFYKTLFEYQTNKEKNNAVFLEYAWDISFKNNLKCDPCVTPLLKNDQVLKLGAEWIKDNLNDYRLYVTRLHLRYENENFPEDLLFQETNNRSNFQGRYIVRNPWKGGKQCLDAQKYFEYDLPMRHKRQAANMVSLTGIEEDEIYRKMGFYKVPEVDYTPWWKRLTQDY